MPAAGYQLFADAQAATGLVDGSMYFVAGETVLYDLGQGHYVYLAAGTGAASIDNIVVTSGGRLKRLTPPNQTANLQIRGLGLGVGTISNADVDSIEDVADIPVTASSILWVSFTVATAALTSFVVQGRVHASGSYFNLASVAADYQYPQGPILWASGDLTVAGTTGVHAFRLDVMGLESIRLRAAGTSSVVAGFYGKA